MIGGDMTSQGPGAGVIHDDDVVILMLSHCLRARSQDSVRLSQLTNGIVEVIMSTNKELAVMSPSDSDVSTIHHLLTTAEISLCYLSSPASSIVYQTCPPWPTLHCHCGNITASTWGDLFKIGTHQPYSEQSSSLFLWSLFFLLFWSYFPIN